MKKLIILTLVIILVVPAITLVPASGDIGGTQMEMVLRINISSPTNGLIPIIPFEIIMIIQAIITRIQAGSRRGTHILTRRFIRRRSAGKLVKI